MGYFKLDRALLEHHFWLERPFGVGQAWVDLIGLAAWANHNVKSRQIKRGQLWTTERYLEKRWGWSRKKVRNFIGRAREGNMLGISRERKRTTGGTIITIINYEQYQAFIETGGENGTTEDTKKEPQKNHRRTTEGPIINKGSKRSKRSKEPVAVAPVASTSTDNSNGNSEQPEDAPVLPAMLNGGHVWAAWVDANRDVGRADPAPVGRNTKAAKIISEAVADLAEAREILSRFLDDTDKWIVGQGHALHLLPPRIDAYRNEPPPKPNPLLDYDPMTGCEAISHEEAVALEPWARQVGIEFEAEKAKRAEMKAAAKAGVPA